MYGKNERNTIVGVEYRCGNGGDWVRAAGAVVRQRVGRGEFHPQLVDDGTQIVGDRVSGQRANRLGRLAQRRCHPVDVVAALAGAGQHGVQALVQTRIVGSAASHPGFLLVRAIPCREGDAEWGRVRDALVGLKDPGQVRRILEGGDHQIVTRPFQDGCSHIRGIDQSPNRDACEMSQRAADVEAGRDKRQCRAERECLGHRVASHPAAIGERLEDRVRGALDRSRSRTTSENRISFLPGRLSNSTMSRTRSVGADPDPRTLDSLRSASYGQFSS